MTTRKNLWTTLKAAPLGACLIIVMFIFSVSCSRGTKTVAAADPSDGAGAPVGVAKIVRTDLSRDLVIAADFRPFQEIDVHAKVAGYVKAIHVDVGDRVKDGQLLATLEIPELQADVTEAGAAVKRSGEEIKRAQGELERAKSAHQVNHLAFARLQAVVKTMPNLVAQQDIDDAQGRDLVAEAQVDAATAALAAAEQQLEVSKANLEKTKSMFAYAQITAPFDGVITKRYADTGAMLPAGTSSSTNSMPLVRLSQNNLLRLIIPVPESAVPKIRLGTQVEVRVPALKKSFQGIVARFADKLDLATRTMDTEIDVPNSKLELVPGMYADASIALDERKDALAVPVQALNRHGAQATVLRVGDGNRIDEQRVTLGLETSDRIEVLSGLKEGDLVVVGGQGQLRPGQKVEPKIVDLTPVREES